MTPANQKVLNGMRLKNAYGINDIIAACAPLIEAGAAPASTIHQQMEIERKKQGISTDDWPQTSLTQLLEKFFFCHSGLLSSGEWRDITQQQNLD